MAFRAGEEDPIERMDDEVSRDGIEPASGEEEHYCPGVALGLATGGEEDDAAGSAHPAAKKAAEEQVCKGAADEQARLASELGHLPLPCVRPSITITVVPPSHNAHLTEGSVVAVPADGMCLYYCGVACQDLFSWRATHHARTGLATDGVAAAGLDGSVVFQGSRCAGGDLCRGSRDG